MNEWGFINNVLPTGIASNRVFWRNIYRLRNGTLFVGNTDHLSRDEAIKYASLQRLQPVISRIKVTIK